MKVTHDDHANIYIEIVADTIGLTTVVLTTSEAIKLVKLLEQHIADAEMEQ